MTSKARIYSLSCALTLCVGAACDDSEPELDDAAAEAAPEAEAKPEFRNLAPDPSAASSYVACVDAGVFAGVDAVIRYPMGANCLSSVSDSPIALLLHGTDFDYDSYPYLLDHLAENGIIAVSLDILAEPDGTLEHGDAADDAQAALDDMLSSWALGSYIDPTRLAIIGHSRGGQTARYLADDLAGGTDAWTVKAIVGLSSKSGLDNLVVGDETVGLLVIQAALDDDQTADRGFENYDRSGSEDSILVPNPGTLYKSMKLLEGGHHAAFSEKFGLGAQAHVSKGYVLAFLAAHMQNDITYYEDYIRGDAVPYGWTGQVVSQVSDGFLRNVIDNFEDGLVGGSTIGGAVSKTLSTTATVHDLASNFDIQGDTHALEVEGRYAGDYIQWSIPAAHADTTAYKYLSMRIGQLDGAATTALRVQLRNGGVWSPELAITDHGTIPMPMDMCAKGWTGCGPIEAEGHMGTVRIPLSAFGDHDDVDAVRIVFRSKSVGKAFVIDSLEFAEWIFKP